MGAVGHQLRMVDSVFLGNALAMTESTPGVITNGGGIFSVQVENVIFYQNDIGLGPNCCGYSMKSVWRQVTFLENRVAVRMDSELNYWYASFSGATNKISQVNFIDSKEWHVQYRGREMFPVTQAYWGTVDETLVRSKIYDVHFDNTLGLVRIYPIQASPLYWTDSTYLSGPLDHPWVPPTSFLGVSLELGDFVLDSGDSLVDEFLRTNLNDANGGGIPSNGNSPITGIDTANRLDGIDEDGKRDGVSGPFAIAFYVTMLCVLLLTVFTMMRCRRVSRSEREIPLPEASVTISDPIAPSEGTLKNK
eukprot:scaffold1684_cov214-Amphora_coffeaeformis.AAC.6